MFVLLKYSNIYVAFSIRHIICLDKVLLCLSLCVFAYLQFHRERKRVNQTMNQFVNKTNFSLSYAFKKGKAHEKNNRPNEAIAIYQSILAHDPNNEEAVLAITNVFLKYNELDNAVKSLHYYLNITVNKHIAHYELGLVYEKKGQQSKAVKSYIDAINSKPDFSLAYAPLLVLLKKLNRLSEMSDIVDRHIKTYPNLAELYWMRASLYVGIKDYPAAEENFELASKYGVAMADKHRFLTEFAFNKDKLKRYNDAMALHKKAQKLASVSPSARIVDTRAGRRFMKDSLLGFNGTTKQQWNEKAESHDNDPIFIIGFPRSGTTMLEQILHSHPRLVVSDELQVLSTQASNIDSIVGREINYPEGLLSLSRSEIIKWRECYFSNMTKHLPYLQKSTDSSHHDLQKRIVDKDPMSVINLGIIQRFFPSSPVLSILRDPRDVCLSCFFQNFKSNASTVNFFSLENTVDYYVTAMNVYLALKERLYLNIKEIKYEDLCADFENIAPQLLVHVGENWSDEILRFHEAQNSRFISTPSFDAVSKAINTKAIENWKNYEAHIHPFIDKLQPFIEAFAYKS